MEIREMDGRTGATEPDCLSPVERQIAAAKRLYTPILPWQIRVLDLQTGEPGSPLEGELHVAHLAHKPAAVIEATKSWIEYNTLSYTWGEPVFRKVITLNGIAYPITENLHAFLAEYRKKSWKVEKRMIWIDAVCINQHDNDEKSVQVSEMVEIYKNASLTLIWLGPSVENTEVAMRFMAEIDPAMPPLSVDDETARLETSTRARLRAGLHDLIHRPWLGRIWIRQEVWSSHNLLVCCGEHVVTWRQFERLRNTAPHDLKDEPRLALLNGIRPPDRAQLYDPKTRLPLRTLLKTTVQCESSDPRDRIYALLGMSCDSPIDIDYNIGVIELFCKLAHTFNSIDQSCRQLYRHAHQDRAHRLSGLPSWCPDWRFSSTDRLFWQLHCPQLARWVKPSLKLPIEPYEQLPMPENLATLKLRGFAIGSLKKLLPSLTGDVYMWIQENNAAAIKGPSNWPKLNAMVEQIITPKDLRGTQTPLAKVTEDVWLSREHQLKFALLRRIWARAPCSRAWREDILDSKPAVMYQNVGEVESMPSVDQPLRHFELTPCSSLLVASTDHCVSAPKGRAAVLFDDKSQLHKRLMSGSSAASGERPKSLHSSAFDALRRMLAAPRDRTPAAITICDIGFDEDRLSNHFFEKEEALKPLAVEFLATRFPRELAVRGSEVREGDIVVMCLGQEGLLVVRPVSAPHRRYEFVGIASVNSEWMIELARRGGRLTLESDPTYLSRSSDKLYTLFVNNLWSVLQEKRDAGELETFELV